MSIEAVLKNYITFTGDQESELIYSSGSLANSPAIQELVSLDSGDNEFNVPDVEDFTVHGLAIVPPALNEIEPILKGASGDTGITLSSTQVSVVMFGSTPPTSVFLVVDEAVAGFRLIWF